MPCVPDGRGWLDLRTVCLSRFPSPCWWPWPAALADDLAQETFLHAWKHLAGLRNPGAFGGCLRQIAVNTWLQHARRLRIPIEAIEESPRALNTPSEGGMSNAAGRIDLATALNTLRPVERLCLVLAYAEGMTHGEIAEATSLPLGTVKSHVTRGTAKLRNWLQVDAPKVLN